jgi:hypothetical protein
MPQFYESYLKSLSPSAIRDYCKKCPDHNGLCELSGDHPLIRFQECDALQERF